MSVTHVKLLPPKAGLNERSAFVDFEDINSAIDAHESINELGGNELRTDYNQNNRYKQSITNHCGHWPLLQQFTILSICVHSLLHTVT